MEISQALETNRQGTVGNIIICFRPLCRPCGENWHTPMPLEHASMYVHTHTHTLYIWIVLRWPTGPWVCGPIGSLWVRARVRCTMVRALHHSSSWLDRPWLWGPSRSYWARSNCEPLRKGFCISVMDYSPTSPVLVDSPDRQAYTHRHIRTYPQTHPHFVFIHIHTFILYRHKYTKVCTTSTNFHTEINTKNTNVQMTHCFAKQDGLHVTMWGKQANFSTSAQRA